MDARIVESLDPIDHALALMYYGWRAMTRQADVALARHRLGRAHHRILFVIARHDGLNVGELCSALGISAQALHRPLKQLSDRGLVISERDPGQHRARILRLSAAGELLEYEASEAERSAMRAAFARCEPAAESQWASVMETLAELDMSAISAG